MDDVMLEFGLTSGWELKVLLSGSKMSFQGLRGGSSGAVDGDCLRMIQVDEESISAQGVYSFPCRINAPGEQSGVYIVLVLMLKVSVYGLYRYYKNIIAGNGRF